MRKGGEELGFYYGAWGGFIAQGELSIDGNSSSAARMLRTRRLGFGRESLRLWIDSDAERFWRGSERLVGVRASLSMARDVAGAAPSCCRPLGRRRRWLLSSHDS
jgi:hypothetical protein